MAACMLLAAAERRLHRRTLAAAIPIGAIPRGDAYGWPTFCAPASSPSPAATRTPTISTGCASIRRSSSPAAACRTAGRTCARSRPSRAGRTRPTCASVIRLMRRDGRSLLRQLRQRRPTGVTLDIDDTVRCRSRPSAALAVQRPLRRALLPADPCLRHGDEPAGRGAAAARQDAVGQARSAAICAAWSAASAATGRRPASPSAATATMAVRRSWTGARTTASTTSSACPATPCSTARR